jgi:hypothetical protein
MGLKLLKLGSFHPPSYLTAKQAAAREEIRGMDYTAYYRWLMGLRNGTSDSFTHYMNEAGWKAREFVTIDDILLQKLEEAGETQRGGSVRSLLDYAGSLPLRDVMRFRWGPAYAKHHRHERVAAYIKRFQPDVLFLREPCHLDGRMFDQFRDRCLIVSLIACQTNHPWNWDAHRSDVIFTFTEEYRKFFEVQGITSEVVPVGFDDRVAEELAPLPKIHDCTFVGYLGVPAQRMKTALLEQVAQHVDFKWWGVKGEEMARYPALVRRWQGEASGIDMLKIYAQSKIVLNDYPDFMQGHSNNLRNMEVFMSGSMLLTRAAANLETVEREGGLVTFDSAASCIAKARHYLAADAEREVIARKGQQLARERFNYRDIAGRMMAVIAEAHDRKRPRLRGWS